MQYGLLWVVLILIFCRIAWLLRALNGSYRLSPNARRIEFVVRWSIVLLLFWWTVVRFGLGMLPLAIFMTLYVLNATIRVVWHTLLPKKPKNEMKNRFENVTRTLRYGSTPARFTGRLLSRPVFVRLLRWSVFVSMIVFVLACGAVLIVAVLVVGLALYGHLKDVPAQQTAVIVLVLGGLATLYAIAALFRR